MNPQTLTLATGIVYVLAFLVGVLNVAIQTGKVLNQWTIPAKVGPYIVVFGSFLGGAYQYLSSLGASLVITGATIFFAVFAGLQALLVGATPAIASHLFGAQVNVKRPTPEPAQVAAAVNAAKTIALVCFAFFMAGALEACGGTAQPGNIPGDVVKIDQGVCALERDLGGPTIDLLCPFGVGGAMVHATAPRDLAVRLIRADAGASK